MKNILLILFVTLVPLFSTAQKYDNIWITGNFDNVHTTEPWLGNSVINFNTAPTTIYYESHNMSFHRAYASICNPATGRLLFYTNGIYIADSTNAMMQNGDSINFDPNFRPGYNFWQANKRDGYDDVGNAFVLPKPNSSTEFYLFHKTLVIYTLPELASTIPDVLSHQIKQSLIDMSRNNGRGRVVYKNLPLAGMDSVTSFAAVKHANGRDWWIVGQQFRMQQFFIGLLTPNGFEYSHTQTFPNIYRRSYRVGIGSNALFSPDGSKLAIYDLMHSTYLFNFDRCTGNLSNYRHIPFPDTLYSQGGVCFSPNSRYLYSVTQFEYVHQYDTDATDILSTDQIVAVNDSFMYAPVPSVNPAYIIMQQFIRPMLAPNGKIYICAAGGFNYLTTIENPDIGSIGCNVQQHSVYLPTFNDETLPNYVNYRLGAMLGSGCDTLTVATLNPIKKSTQIQLFPNPTSDEITLQTPDDLAAASLQITDVFGRVLRQETLVAGANKWSVRDLPQGVYVVRIATATKTLETTKFTVAR